MDIKVEIATARWTISKIVDEINTLKRSGQFNSLVNAVPSTITRVGFGRLITRSAPLKEIVVTDSLVHFNDATWLSAEQVAFDYATGILYVGINPINGAKDRKAPFRQLRVGELIAHGVAHYTQRANDAYNRDPAGNMLSGPQSETEGIAVEYANKVASDFKLTPLVPGGVTLFPYDPLYCTASSFNNSNVPMFFSGQ